MIPIEIKNSSTVEKFKNEISNWKHNGCDCKFCQDYLYRIGILTWLMTNPFAASVLILVIPDPNDPFTYKLEGCCKHLQMW